MLGGDSDAVSFEDVEVGACGDAVGGGVPPVFFFGNVVAVIDTSAPAVEDGQLVVFETVVFNQSSDDKAVVDAVAIGGYHVAEGEGGVAMVAFPKDVEAVVYGAVAAGLVVGVVEVVGYGVGKQCVENGPRQLGFENRVANSGVGAGDDVERDGEYAVLAVAAGVGKIVVALLSEGEGVDGHGQLVGAEVVEGGVVVVEIDL